ncbi:unnamed protein product [Soboliphyme baturini]|uniref:F5/8 type C domain-containing protein n=1 Tax=Soboliphyme baturini TaxID=241478 RepID=A0A183IKU7_9BILA|nr:unnamed protein product [Soboliphyme baturini]
MVKTFCIMLQLTFVSTTHECGVALGMETEEIGDRDITASSSFDMRSVGPQNARIRTETGGGAWCPERQIQPEVREWLQIDLKTVKVITAIETQGRYDHGIGMEYTPTYAIEYWRPKMDSWHRYKDRSGKEILIGNNNTFTPVFRAIDSPFIATKIRIIPLSDYIRTVCLRVELYGCTYTGAMKFEYSETRNDGVLTDDSPFEWVGWQRSISGFTTEMVFKFSEVRNFTSISIHYAHQSHLDASVFSAAHLFFSVNGDVKTDSDFLEFRPHVPSLNGMKSFTRI